MKAVVWHGPRDVRVDRVSDPRIQQSTDAIVRITSTAICGSDLHLYEVLGPFLDEGDILGHEPMGIVEEVGADVHHIKPGDRVVIPFNISCGDCYMCHLGLHSQCETTQVTDQGCGAALFGYTKLYGQVPGGQAELLRVPQAHFGPVKIPEGPPDERFLYLSDVLPTAMQAVEYASIPEGGSVTVLGLGPIGQMSARIARHRGARVIAVEPVAERREMAGRHDIEVLDLNAADDVGEAIREQTGGRGTDSVIDAVGMEAHGSPVGKLAQNLTVAVARPCGPDADRESRRRPAECAADRRGHGAPRRHGVGHRRLWRHRRSVADDDHVRQAGSSPHGPGERQAVDRRPHATPDRRGRSAGRGRPCHSSVAAERGGPRLRDLPEESRRCHQGGAEP